MTIPHYVNEDQSDIRAIKPGWYAMESNGKLSSGPFPRPGEMPHRNHSAEEQFSSIALVGAGHQVSRVWKRARPGVHWLKWIWPGMD